MRVYRGVVVVLFDFNSVHVVLLYRHHQRWTTTAADHLIRKVGTDNHEGIGPFHKPWKLRG